MHNEAMGLLGKFYPPEGTYLKEISNFTEYRNISGLVNSL
jgi:hypothetical protein